MKGGEKNQHFSWQPDYWPLVETQKKEHAKYKYVHFEERFAP